MFEINLRRDIKASRETVWGVICDLQRYPQWNEFVVSCESSLEVGSAIKMRVRMAPNRVISQTETVRQNRQQEILEYGIKAPLGLLSSSRKHILTRLDEHTTRYESTFCLRGLLVPLVKLFTGKGLRQGFAQMTDGIVKESEKQQGRKNPASF